MMLEPSLSAHLVKEAQTLGVSVDARLLRGLSGVLDLLLHWNRRINLTAVRDPAGIVDKHFLDSLALLPHIPAAAATLVDAGSGPGFPGAVLALARPELQVTLVEANQKKAAFLQTLRRTVPLDNVTVAVARVEAFLGRPDFAPFDVAVSRATWPIAEWLTLGPRLVRPGGIVLGMEGATESPLPPGATRMRYRIANADRALVVFHVEH